MVGVRGEGGMTERDREREGSQRYRKREELTTNLGVGPARDVVERRDVVAGSILCKWTWRGVCEGTSATWMKMGQGKGTKRSAEPRSPLTRPQWQFVGPPSLGVARFPQGTIKIRRVRTAARAPAWSARGGEREPPPQVVRGNPPPPPPSGIYKFLDPSIPLAISRSTSCKV